MSCKNFLHHTTTSNHIQQLRAALQCADAIVLGAGAGLSTSAGFLYSGPRFQTYFSDFAAQYAFYDMYAGGFYPYKTLEEYWAGVVISGLTAIYQHRSLYTANYTHYCMKKIILS